MTSPSTRSSRRKQPARTCGPHGLTLAEEVFAAQIALGKSQTEAYMAANPEASVKNAGRQGCVWADKPHVKARIATLMRSAAESVQRVYMVDAENTLMQAVRIGFSDVRRLFKRTEAGELRARDIDEIDTDTALALQSVKVSRQRTRSNVRPDGETETVEDEIIEYRFADKNAAVTNLMRHFNLFAVENKDRADQFAQALRAFVAERATLPVNPEVEAKQHALIDDTPTDADNASRRLFR